ncbi:MAG: hypothetical protein C5B51_03530, partial [Terriglobia bacterium]
MALGDGIRRNVAKISQEERDLLIDAFLQLDTTKFYPDGVTFWDKQEEIHKEAHAAGQDVHGGPGFLPWHRELCNRLEALLREVHPELSLHYWDWTTDPRASDNGAEGTVNLFTPQFMGDDGRAGINRIPADGGGDAGVPLQNFEDTEGAETGDGHNFIWRKVAGGAPPPSPPPVDPDSTVVTSGDSGPQDNQFPVFRRTLELNNHNPAHGYIGGTLNFQHYSFHDPFVFLLHSNVDRLWAMWQLSSGKGWRLDPNLVYGAEGSSASINDALQPWAGTEPPLLRPWAPPDNQQLVKTSKDLTVVLPPRYDTNPVHLHELRLEPTGWAQADLSAIVTNNPPAFPLAAGSPLSAVVTPDGIRRIFYVGQDNDIRELRLEPTGWAQADLSAIVTNNPPAFPLAAGSPLAAVVTPDGIPRIFHVGRDNDIRELRLEPTGWAQADLSAIVTNNPPAFPLAAGSPLSAVVTPDGIPRIFYVGQDNDIRELRLEPTGWVQADLSAIVTNNPPAFPLAAGS